MECKHRKGISRGEIDEKERNINLLFNNNNIFYIYVRQYSLFYTNIAQLFSFSPLLLYIFTNKELIPVFIFCNYLSDRYELNDHPSEALARRFVEMGYKDGMDITSEIVRMTKDGRIY